MILDYHQQGGFVECNGIRPLYPEQKLFISLDFVNNDMPMGRYNLHARIVNIANDPSPETRSISLPILYYDFHPPKISTLTPSKIENSVTNLIKIKGRNFLELPAMLVGETEVKVSFISDKELEATMPAGFQTGNYDITVINPDGKSIKKLNSLKVR